MARRSGSSGLYLPPAGHHGRFPLPLALAILPPLTGDAGDYTDNATSRITAGSRITHYVFASGTRSSTSVRRGVAEPAAALINKKVLELIVELIWVRQAEAFRVLLHLDGEWISVFGPDCAQEPIPRASDQPHGAVKVLAAVEPHDRGSGVRQVRQSLVQCLPQSRGVVEWCFIPAHVRAEVDGIDVVQFL